MLREMWYLVRCILDVGVFRRDGDRFSNRRDY